MHISQATRIGATSTVNTFFLTQESALECNTLVKKLTNGLFTELDANYEIFPILAGIDESGHIAIISDDGQGPGEIAWSEHACT